MGARRPGTPREAGSIFVPVAIGGPGTHRQRTFAGIFRGWFTDNPLAALESMSQAGQESCESLSPHRQSHEPSQPLLAPGPAGLGIESLIRIYLVGTSRSLASSADTLMDSLRGKNTTALEAPSRVWTRRGHAGVWFVHGQLFQFRERLRSLTYSYASKAQLYS